MYLVPQVTGCEGRHLEHSPDVSEYTLTARRERKARADLSTWAEVLCSRYHGCALLNRRYGTWRFTHGLKLCTGALQVRLKDMNIFCRVYALDCHIFIGCSIQIAVICQTEQTNIPNHTPSSLLWIIEKGSRKCSTCCICVFALSGELSGLLSVGLKLFEAGVEAKQQRRRCRW